MIYIHGKFLMVVQSWLIQRKTFLFCFSYLKIEDNNVEIETVLISIGKFEKLENVNCPTTGDV
jgi:hypothetical protein